MFVQLAPVCQYYGTELPPSSRARRPPFQILIATSEPPFPACRRPEFSPAFCLSVRQPSAEPGGSRRGCEPLRAGCGNHNMQAAAETAIKYLAALVSKKGHEESCGMYVMTVEAFLCFSLLPPPYCHPHSALSGPRHRRRWSCVRVYIKM